MALSAMSLSVMAGLLRHARLFPSRPAMTGQRSSVSYDRLS